MKMWFAVDMEGTMTLFPDKPERYGASWINFPSEDFEIMDETADLFEDLPELLDMSWVDEPVQLDIDLSSCTGTTDID